jgi:CheY-like chemotaxis protein
MQVVWVSTNPVDAALRSLGAELAWASTWEELEVAVSAAADQLYRMVLLVEEDALAAAPGRAGLVAWIREMGGRRFQVLVGDSGAPGDPSAYASALTRPIDPETLRNVLHLAQSREPTRRGPKPLRSAGAGAGAGTQALQVLLADDDPINQVVIAQMLRRAGHAVVVVEDGERALDALTSDRFDVAVVDLHMPRLDGIEAIRRYQAGGSGRHLTPCILLTANATREVRERVAGVLVAAFLTKPVGPEELVGTVERASAGISGVSVQQEQRRLSSTESPARST